MQSEASRSFVHEAYRFQALPTESRGELASSMASRARPRAARAPGDGLLSSPPSSAGGRRRGRSSSTPELRSNQLNSSSSGCDGGGGGGVGGRWGRVWFEDGDPVSSGDEESEIGGEGGRGGGLTDPEREEVDLLAAGGDGSGDSQVEDGGAGTSPALDSAGETTGERAEGGEAEDGDHEIGMGGVSPRKSHTTEGGDGRKAWGAGLRMYV